MEFPQNSNNGSIGSLGSFYPNGMSNSDSPKNSNSKGIWIVLGIVVVLAIGLGVWFFVLRQSSFQILSPLSQNKNKNAIAGGSAPVDATKIMNPLTGMLFPENAAAWVNNRPLGVMVNNHVDARPQSGLIYADVVYEVIAEGGITRFLAFFDTNTPEKIGPVRSIREYFLVLVKEMGDAMVMHIGYSPQALLDIEQWPVRSLARGGATFWRDETLNVAIEHTAYVNGKDLRTLGSSLGWDGLHSFTPWKFKDDPAKYSTSPAASEVTIDFWTHGDYTAYFKYDSSTNSYLRFSGVDANDKPIALLDRETKQQVAVQNLIVEFATETSIPGDEKNRLDYQLVGSGEALVFIDGHVVKATWSKASRDARAMFYDMNGNEIEFNRGKFWISIVPDRNVKQVVYD